MNENTTIENEVLDDEIGENLDDVELEEDDAEAVEDTSEAESDEDGDFEYDEEGNIVIPEDEENEEADEGDEEPEAENAEKGEDSKSDEAKAPENTEQKEISNIKAELEKFKAQSRETLEKLGVKIDDDDVLGGLIRLAAEAEDTTPEEYLKRKEENEKLEAAKKIVEQQQGEAIRKADLEELHRLFPETSGYTDISQIPNFKRFGELRVMGLPASEAYSASHTNAIRENAAAGAKRQSLAGTKNHLQTAIPKGAKDTSIIMPKKTLSEWRELFPGKSDKDIISLYKKTLN